MKFKIIITIFTMMLLINCTFVCAVNINKKVNEKQSISKSSIEIDYAPIEKLSLKYFKLVYEKIGTPDCKLCISTDDDFNKTLGYSSGTSTIFEPPYSNCFSWGDGTFGIDEYSHGCNKYSGAIGAYANAWIGGATAEAMQRLDFYVGRQKTVDITAKIVRTGGKTTFGFGGFAGTEKTWSWDDFQNNYHRSDVDPWWTWELILLKIISIVTLLTGYSPNGIGEAISLLSSIFDFEALENELDEMLDDGDAEILYITFSFFANPGYHKIWVGLRGTASACVTGMGAAVTMGQVEKITIDGIAAPESPSINGPSFCDVDTSYEFSGQSYDPNGDKIRYYFDWGDGTNSGWTEYKTSGTRVYKSHSYKNKGTYKLRLIVEDIDKMKTEATKTIKVGEEGISLKTQIIKELLNNNLNFCQNTIFPL